MTVKLGLRASNRVAGALRTTMPAVSPDTHHQAYPGVGESERGLVARSLKPLTLRDILSAADSGIPPQLSGGGYDALEEPMSPGGARSNGSACPLTRLYGLAFVHVVSVSVKRAQQLHLRLRLLLRSIEPLRPTFSTATLHKSPPFTRPPTFVPARCAERSPKPQPSSLSATSLNDARGASMVSSKPGESVRGGDANSTRNGDASRGVMGRLHLSRSLLAGSRVPEKPQDAVLAQSPEGQGAGAPVPAGAAAATAADGAAAKPGVLRRLASLLKPERRGAEAKKGRDGAAARPALKKVSAYATTLDRRGEQTGRGKRGQKPRHVVFRNLQDVTAEARAASSHSKRRKRPPRCLCS